MPLKKCFKCETDKDISEFYKHKGMSDGHLNKCQECTKKDVLRYRKENINKVRAYDRMRGGTQKRIDANTKRTREYRVKFPLKYKAITAVNNAISDGRLIKPKVCSLCLLEGRQIEGHHNDYSEPLDVVWLCSACHKKMHF